VLFVQFKGQLFFLQPFDAYIGAVFNRLQYGFYFVLLALDLHRHAAVVLVAHPSGEAELVCRAIGPVAKADALYVAGECVLESFLHSSFLCRLIKDKSLRSIVSFHKWHPEGSLYSAEDQPTKRPSRQLPCLKMSLLPALSPTGYEIMAMTKSSAQGLKIQSPNSLTQNQFT